jgi:hypothetical protein
MRILNSCPKGRHILKHDLSPVKLGRDCRPRLSPEVGLRQPILTCGTNYCKAARMAFNSGVGGMGTMLSGQAEQFFTWFQYIFRMTVVAQIRYLFSIETEIPSVTQRPRRINPPLFSASFLVYRWRVSLSLPIPPPPPPPKPATVSFPCAVVMSIHEKKVQDSSSYVEDSEPKFYDPSKESIWTRLGVNAESFKRAPGTTGYGSGLCICKSDL